MAIVPDAWVFSPEEAAALRSTFVLAGQRLIEGMADAAQALVGFYNSIPAPVRGQLGRRARHQRRYLRMMARARGEDPYLVK